MVLRIADSYQITLRAVGQALESIGVEQFELRVHADFYLVHGFCKEPKPHESLTLSATTGVAQNLKQHFKSSVSSGPQSSRSFSSLEFTGLKFTLNDIKRFGLKVQDTSANSEGIADPHRVSQTLRMAGAYVDQKESQLIRLNWRPGFVALWRKDEFSNESKDIFTPKILYDLWVRQYKRRTQMEFNQTMRAGNG